MFLLLNPAVGSAAEIRFDPQDSAIGTEGVFAVGVDITSEERINAITLVLPIPPGLTPLEVSDGNSVATLFLQKPQYDEASRSVTFSAVIPNGFSGEDGRLITLILEPEKRVGSATFVVDPESEAYAGEGERVSLTAVPLTLPFSLGKRNLANTIPDYDPPEAFDPVVVSANEVGAPSPVLAFFATDKGSGIARYEVKESVWGNWFTGVGWKEATSPYPLMDTRRASFIYVRATDRAGNTYVAMLPPERMPLTVYSSLFACGIVLLFFIYVIRARRSR